MVAATDGDGSGAEVDADLAERAWFLVLASGVVGALLGLGLWLATRNGYSLVFSGIGVLLALAAWSRARRR